MATHTWWTLETDDPMSGREVVWSGQTLDERKREFTLFREWNPKDEVRVIRCERTVEVEFVPQPPAASV